MTHVPPSGSVAWWLSGFLAAARTGMDDCTATLGLEAVMASIIALACFGCESDASASVRSSAAEAVRPAEDSCNRAPLVACELGGPALEGKTAEMQAADCGDRAPPAACKPGDPVLEGTTAEMQADTPAARRSSAGAGATAEAQGTVADAGQEKPGSTAHAKHEATIASNASSRASAARRSSAGAGATAETQVTIADAGQEKPSSIVHAKDQATIALDVPSGADEQGKNNDQDNSKSTIRSSDIDLIYEMTNPFDMRAPPPAQRRIVDKAQTVVETEDDGSEVDACGSVASHSSEFWQDVSAHKASSRNARLRVSQSSAKRMLEAESDGDG